MSNINLSQTRLSVYDVTLSEAGLAIPATESAFFYVESGTPKVLEGDGSVLLEAGQWFFPEHAFEVSGKGPPGFMSLPRLKLALSKVQA